MVAFGPVPGTISARHGQPEKPKTSVTDESEAEQRRARQDIRRELADDHYRRTAGQKLRDLAAQMRAEVAASPGVIHLDRVFHCHLCGAQVTEAARSQSNPNLFLCADCRGKWKRK